MLITQRIARISCEYQIRTVLNAWVTKGCAAVIQQQFPLAVYYYCMNHDLSLAISKTCQLPEIRVMLAAATEIALFFMYSPKKQTCLEGIIADVNEQRATSDKIRLQKVKTLRKTLGRTPHVIICVCQIFY